MLNKRLKELRNQHRYTQQELAEKLGVAQRTIAFYEKGERHPDYETLIKIADLFDCSLDYLLGRTNNKNETLNHPNENEALIVLAKGSKVNPEKIKEYIDFLKSQKHS